MNRTVLFTGRFDRVHVGHIATIQKLGLLFRKVIVCILDYPGQRFPVEHRYDVMKTILDNSVGNFEVVINGDNFETVEGEKVREMRGVLGWEVYASGNPKCIAHMKALGYETFPTARSWDYEAHLEQ